MLQKVKEVLSKFEVLSPKDVLFLISISRVKRYKKGDYLIRVGEKNHNTILVISGLLRSYHINDVGEEITMSFIPEKHHAGSYATILKDEPSVENLVTLEDSLVLVTDARKFKEAERNNPSLLRFQNKNLRNILAEAIDRIWLHTSLTAEQRYLWFCEKYPNLEQRVKQKHLASFLGVTPTSLSRMKARLLQA